MTSTRWHFITTYSRQLSSMHFPSVLWAMPIAPWPWSCGRQQKLIFSQVCSDVYWPSLKTQNFWPITFYQNNGFKIMTVADVKSKEFKINVDTEIFSQLAKFLFCTCSMHTMHFWLLVLKIDEEILRSFCILLIWTLFHQKTW